MERIDAARERIKADETAFSEIRGKICMVLG